MHSAFPDCPAVTRLLLALPRRSCTSECQYGRSAWCGLPTSMSSVPCHLSGEPRCLVHTRESVRVNSFRDVLGRTLCLSASVPALSRIGHPFAVSGLRVRTSLLSATVVLGLPPSQQLPTLPNQSFRFAQMRRRVCAPPTFSSGTAHAHSHRRAAVRRRTCR